MSCIYILEVPAIGFFRGLSSPSRAHAGHTKKGGLAPPLRMIGVMDCRCDADPSRA